MEKEKLDISYLKRNFFNTAVADIYRALDGKSIIGAFILTFCLIDYLTWIEFGDQKYGFNQWIKKRLVPLDFCYTGSDEELYSVRNGLVHSYGPSRKMTENVYTGYRLVNGHPGDHLQKINTEHLRIDLYSLLCDTTFAAHLVFEDLKKECKDDQLDRLKRQIKTFGQNPPEKYGEMHRALACMDQDVIELNDLKAAYTELILYS
jgi:hypothetical protein